LHPKENNALAFPAMGTQCNNLVSTFSMKWLCYSRLSVFANCEMIPKHETCSLKNPFIFVVCFHSFPPTSVSRNGY